MRVNEGGETTSIAPAFSTSHREGNLIELHDADGTYLPEKKPYASYHCPFKPRWIPITPRRQMDWERLTNPQREATSYVTPNEARSVQATQHIHAPCRLSLARSYKSQQSLGTTSA